ncbi:NUDIX hydrolase [Tomitella biformata]|uniref:NUDIX hydrolase n=1 Tax=Tomitella biformata TaxID=630403 RepID=UPI00046480F8|nr:NUDIX domain-containing protein [Tomitella biformata]
MTFSALTITNVGLVLLVLLLIGVWAYGTANRLDRLHVRTDLAWQALDAALSRRAVVVRSLGVDLPAAEADRLTALTLRAERVDRDQREGAENDLARALARIDAVAVRPAQQAEMADADARVLIARRFHNDAVRNTRALQGRRLVRWLRLGGTADMPEYFDISEHTLRTGAPSELPREYEPGSTRVSARVVLLDGQSRTLLLRGRDPQGVGEPFWFTFGGGVEAGESLREAAVRELYEETGLQVAPDLLGGPIWRRMSLFPFNGDMMHSEEHFFALRVEHFEPVPAGLTELEQVALLEHRWCSAEEVTALGESGEMVYPQDLARLLPDAERFADGLAEGQGPVEERTIR